MKELFERLESIRQNDCLIIHFRHAYQVESVLCEKRDSLIESRGAVIVTVEYDGLAEAIGSDFYTGSFEIGRTEMLYGESVEVGELHIEND